MNPNIIKGIVKGKKLDLPLRKSGCLRIVEGNWEKSKD